MQYLPLVVCLVLLSCQTEARRVRVRARPIQEEQLIQESAEDDNQPEQAVQYYRADKRADNDEVVYVASDDEYNGVYGQTTARPRLENARQQPQSQRSTVTVAPRSKSQQQNVVRAPPVQTIRNYNKVNDDGSFTFGYEAADGSFKEETRGTDCVVRGKYGYVDPDGNKREFTYVSGNPCDPNNPDESEEEPERSGEDSDENIPQNYPKRPVLAPRPVRPLQSSTRAPTTVFSNNYNNQNNGGEDDDSSEEDQPQTVTIGPKQRPTLRPLPQQNIVQNQIQTVTQRPRVQILNTTPSSVTVYSPRPSVNITPRPSYHSSSASPSYAPPQPTTYRPLTVSPKQEIATTPFSFVTPTKATSLLGNTRGPLDFDAEFKKFQHENQISSTPSSIQSPSAKPSYTLQKINTPVTNSPIYQSQLVFNPSTGEYDTQLYQSQGDFQLNQRIQPYQPTHQAPVHQQTIQHRPPPQQQQQPQFLSLDQIQNQSPLYRHQLSNIQASPQPSAQIPQQIYQKQQNELQFHNSQQLFAQQLEFQQSQLHRDRIEAAKKVSPQVQQPHRFQVPSTHPQLQRQVQHPQQQPFYYIQPQHSQSGGQIDAFLRGHNIEY